MAKLPAADLIGWEKRERIQAQNEWGVSSGRMGVVSVKRGREGFMKDGYPRGEMVGLG